MSSTRRCACGCAKAWASLEERFGDDPTFDLVKNIDRYLAVMAQPKVADSQEASDAR